MGRSAPGLTAGTLRWVSELPLRWGWVGTSWPSLLSHVVSCSGSVIYSWPQPSEVGWEELEGLAGAPEQAGGAAGPSLWVLLKR